MPEALRVIKVYQTNPFEPGQGGGVRYVRNLVDELKQHCEEILFFGVAPGRMQQGNVTLIPVTRSLGGYVIFLARLSLKILFMDLNVRNKSLKKTERMNAESMGTISRNNR